MILVFLIRYRRSVVVNIADMVVDVAISDPIPRLTMPRIFGFPLIRVGDFFGSRHGWAVSGGLDRSPQLARA